MDQGGLLGQRILCGRRFPGIATVNLENVDLESACAGGAVREAPLYCMVMASPGVMSRVRSPTSSVCYNATPDPAHVRPLRR